MRKCQIVVNFILKEINFSWWKWFKGDIMDTNLEKFIATFIVIWSTQCNFIKYTGNSSKLIVQSNKTYNINV